MASKDEVALARYGVMYAKLSPFGRRDIDKAFEEPVYAVTLQQRAEDDTLRHTKMALTKQLDVALQENAELWEENTELRTELEELRSQFNPPSS